ncbi:MAG: Extracellular basic protease [Stenotrophomonas maltophilia]|uniref:Extracellular basic protease n=1 Tax=Stenotrophomonas maltophilia TaxID=40324 RepID=A0A7V8JKR5_STEMA|nr:MAG: Extracellular basic protease [Stenotrophomonas maltophilia]
MRPAWDKATGTGVVVAVIDTGITNHPDLNANILPGYDFISDTALARDGNGRDSNPNDEGDWYGNNECQPGYPASNSSWHGTHVAGTVAAVTNNSIGVAGTAFNAKVVPVRVLGKCGGYTSEIADAIVWASGGSVSGVPANANPAEVINLSLGGGGSCSATYQNAINGAVGRGTTAVVAAANTNTNVSSSVPANCANVIAAAATTSAGARASFSNYGAGIDISAPGQGILSTLNTGTTVPGSPTYASYNGTSMAAPHVAGVVALMQSVAPSPLSPAQVETIIKNTARPLPGACSGGCGAGIIDADAAVTAVINGTGGGTNPNPGGNDLQNNVPVTGLSAASGASLAYPVTVPAGRSQLRAAISGGSGDADLYLRQGSAPTDTTYTCRPYLSGNNETSTVSNPAAGVWHVRVKAYSTFSGLSLTAQY